MRLLLLILLLLGGAIAWVPVPTSIFDPPTLHAIDEVSRAMSRRGEVPLGQEPPLRLRRIVLDPGHGGENRGAVGVAQVDEKLLTLNLAYALRDALSDRFPGTEVLLTRYWDRDVGLDERIAWANAIDADLFVSLHYNAATHDRALGYETFYLDEELLLERQQPGRRRSMATPTHRRAGVACDRARVAAHTATQLALAAPHAESKRLAKVIQAQLARGLTDSIDRGVKQANFAVLRGAQMPAVVVEAGFLTHPIEGVGVLQKTHRDAVVHALVEAIGEFGGGSAAEDVVVEAGGLVRAVEPLQRGAAQDAQVVEALLVR